MNNSTSNAMQNLKKVIDSEKAVKPVLNKSSFIPKKTTKTPSLSGVIPPKGVTQKVDKPVPEKVNEINKHLFGVIENNKKTMDSEDIKKKKTIMRKKLAAKMSKKSDTSSSSSSSASSNSSDTSNSGGSEMSGSAGSENSGSELSSGSECSFDKVASAKKRRKDELLQEKVEMLTRIGNLSGNGFSTTKKWAMKDDIDEIRFECYRMQRESNAKKSVKMMRQMLISITTLVEMGNRYFNPFNLQLDGFSQSMMRSLSDFDDCFDQLHHKYSNRTSMGPETQLLFTFVSSAVFHHAGNAVTKKASSSPGSQNPLSAVMGLMGAMGGAKADNSSPMRTVKKPVIIKPIVEVHESSSIDSSNTKIPETVVKRKTMKGPSSGMMPMDMFGSLTAPTSTTDTEPSMKIPLN